MRPMQLHPRETSISHQPRRIHKLSNNPLNIPPRHLPWTTPRNSCNNPFHKSTADINRHLAGRNRRRKHTPFTGDAERLAAWVADLDYGGCAVLLAGGGVFFPICEQGSVSANVFSVEGWVEGRAHVVYVDLDVSWGRC